MTQPPPATDFEQSMQELEVLVERLEAGDLSLEESLRVFERGVALTRNCQKALGEAEQKVRLLSQRDGADTLQPFAPPAPGSE